MSVVGIEPKDLGNKNTDLAAGQGRVWFFRLLKEGSEPSGSEEKKAWSPEARAAAAAARAKKGGVKEEVAGPKHSLSDVEIAENTPNSTKVSRTIEVEGRLSPPPTENVRLLGDEKPVDYGAVHDLLKEKYGEKRGEQSYQSMAEHPNAARGLHFVVGNKIALEKKAMMKLLGKTGNLEDHHYQGLYKLWRSKQGETKPLPDTLELILKAWNPIR